ncbi:hypothetical protein scyTo_0005952 [Scyliorhinus torazame]|uniref:Uncharacterized protein n=1 Tax=Scyliorhinus torazame TaxID=75743 RepID=A0A401PED0_SCYTO|nr:hypothetical protein [Scyliorhinus torazame]
MRFTSAKYLAVISGGVCVTILCVYCFLENGSSDSNLRETISETLSLKSNVSSEEVRSVGFWVAATSSGKNGNLLKNVAMSAPMPTEPPFSGDRYATDDTYLHSVMCAVLEE